jgi:methylated-DNA-[protein]-cysteine S-methyltransferase
MKFPTATVQTRFESPLGSLILAAHDNHLVGIWFEGQRHQPDASAWPDAAGHPVLQAAQAQLTDYFAARRSAFTLPLARTQGTAFQQAVWQSLLAIPAGTTCSYGEISRRIGRPSAVRAVGAAIGRNPWSIVLPCHRVVGAHGALTGYAGGLARKTALLQLEGAR